MKFTLEIDLDKLVITDGVKGIGSQVASALRDAILGHLGTQTEGRLLDWNGEIAGKWQVKEEEQANPLDQSYRDAAEEKFGSEGQIEIDSDAVISYGDDDGAYVQAWLWVEGNLVPTPCSGESCKELVDSEGKYHASPCGTFCVPCMEEHAFRCQICADEFDLEYDVEEAANN